MIDISAIIQYIRETFEKVDVLSQSGDAYIFYEPGDEAPPDHRFPFATIVTDDKHGSFSNLNRSDVFRLNVGVTKPTFQSLFGLVDFREGDGMPVGFDFTTLDVLLPHPVYGRMHWLCVLNVGEATFEKLKPLLAEAYSLAVKRHPHSRSPAAQ